MTKYFGAFCLSIILASCTPSQEEYTLAVGTYTRKEGHVDGKAEGIYIIKQNKRTGQLTMSDTISGAVNPSYLAIHPETKSIYAVNEIATANEKNTGTVSAFHHNQDEKRFELINKVLSQGDAPCHITFDSQNKYAIVSNYMGSISSFPIKADYGLGQAIDTKIHEPIGYLSPRQEAPHPHMALVAPDGESILVSDLGSNDIKHYKFNEGMFTLVATTPMLPLAGPRHMATSKVHDKIYVLNELSNAIEVFDWQGVITTMNRIQSASLFKDATKKMDTNSSAIHIHPNGRFLYAANRSNTVLEDNTISIFILESSGQIKLTDVLSTGGFVPRDFSISPDGRFLLVAHQNSDDIRTFEIGKDGALTSTGFSLNIPTPVCLKYFDL